MKIASGAAGRKDRCEKNVGFIPGPFFSFKTAGEKSNSS
jgi:hypothetical protein